MLNEMSFKVSLTIELIIKGNSKLAAITDTRSSLGCFQGPISALLINQQYSATVGWTSPSGKLLGLVETPDQCLNDAASFW